MGVTLSVTSLVMALAQDQSEQYKTAYVKAAQRLKKIVVDNDIAPDYLYYKVPCPWIQVKLLRLMQCYPPSGRLDLPKYVLNSDKSFRRYTCPKLDSRVTSTNFE